MEHLALQILIDSNTMKATRTARDFQEFFHEILVDEYQDSNLVQEYLLQSISKEELGTYNRFMVGDVNRITSYNVCYTKLLRFLPSIIRI